jgi:dihydrofolate reductase
MTDTICHLAISLDGFTAGTDQSLQNPLGVGGEELHSWMFVADEPGHEIDARMRDLVVRPRGAYVMGRNMYGPIRGEWSGDWRGWWGEEPPYHAPVFVLTHHPREPVEMRGGTTFHFVTDGFYAAYARAVAAAGDKGVSIAGGASTVRQALAAGVIDELVIHTAPILLGAGERPFEAVSGVTFEPFEAAQTRWASHVRYRVGR